MKTIQILKDWKFWKGLIILEIVVNILIWSLLPPILSTLTVKTGNNYLGFVTKGNYDRNNDKVNVFDNSTITLRHELIHQAQEHRGYPKNIFIRELEAYTESYFFWNKVNLTTMDWER